MGKAYTAIVVAGTFLNLFLSNGFRHCIGLFFVKWQDDFDGTAEQISWIGSNILVGYATAGLLIVMFGSRVSCRVLAFSGGTCACIALACCVFANEVWHMFFLMFLTGFGLGMVRSASLTVISFYVKKRIGVAYGIVGAGSSFGLLLLSQVFTALIDTYSWKGAMLVISGIMANQSVVGALYRQTNSEASANAKTFDSSCDPGHHNQLSENNNEGECFEYLSVETKRKQSVGQRIRKRSSQVAVSVKNKSVQVANNITKSDMLAIMTNIRLLSFNIANFLRGFGFFACMVHFVALCLDNDVPLRKSAMLLSLIGIAGIAACLTHGFLVDKRIITALNLQGLVLLTGGLSCIMIAIHANFVTLLVFSLVFGAASSIFFALVPGCVRQILDEDLRLVKGTIGIGMTFTAGGGLIGIPILGRLFDMTQDYAASFYLAGAMFFAAGILHCMDPLLVVCQRNWKKSHGDENGP